MYFYSYLFPYSDLIILTKSSIFFCCSTSLSLPLNDSIASSFNPKSLIKLSFKYKLINFLKDFWISSKTATRNFYFYVFDNLFKDKLNFQNKSLILLDKLTLQNKASYKTIEFNILIDQVYFEYYFLIGGVCLLLL